MKTNKPMKSILYTILFVVFISCALCFFNVYVSSNSFAIVSSDKNSKSFDDTPDSTIEFRIKALNRALRDNNPGVRVKAINELDELNSFTNIRLIRELLLDDSHSVRIATLKSITKNGNLAENFTAEVVENANSTNDKLKYAAIVTLTNISNLNKQHNKLIVDLLVEENKRTRNLALKIIEMNPQLAVDLTPEILQLMKNEDPKLRASAVRALGIIGKPRDIPQISLLLDDEDLFVRANAAIALGAIGKPSKSQARKIAELLNEKNLSVRLNTIKSLGLIRDIPKDLQQILVDFLLDRDKRVSNAAVKAIAMIGSENPAEVTDSLDSLLKGKNTIGVINSLRVYREIGEPAHNKAENIAELLNHENPAVRNLSILVLGKMGESGKKQSDKIEALLQDENPGVVFSAASTLILMGRTSIDLSPIVDFLKNNNRNLRLTAANILVQSGEIAKPQIPKIIALLKHGNAKYRNTAILTLSKMGETARYQISEIVELLKDANPVIRSSALQTLGKMGQYASGQVEQITPLLKDPDKIVRGEAAWALGQLVPEAETQVPAIANLLNDDSKHVRINSIDALSQMGSLPSNVTNNIANLLKEEDLETRRAAIIASGRLCENAPELKTALIELVKENQRTHDLDLKSKLYGIQSIGECVNLTYEEAGSIIEFLYSENLALRNKAEETLWKVSPINESAVVDILGATYYNTTDNSGLRLLAYYIATGNEKAEKLIKWVGKNANNIPDKMDRESSLEALDTYLGYWDLTVDNDHMRKDFAGRINQVVTVGNWTKEDLPLLHRVQMALETSRFFDEANFVKVKIQKLNS